jgi:hypothetical protein
MAVYGVIPVSDGQWHHIAGVFDVQGGTMELYVDGVLDQSILPSGTINDTSDPVLLGANSEYLTTRLWNGRIDEVRIWSVARSQAEIMATMWAGLTGSEPGLVAYYRFNEGVAGGNNSNPPIDTLPDLTAHGNHGLLLNFSLTGETSNWVRSTIRGIFLDDFESGDTSGWSAVVP